MTAYVERFCADCRHGEHIGTFGTCPCCLAGHVEDTQFDAEDDLYREAVIRVQKMEFVSISLLQREVRTGYNRAARMLERMEREGIVGPIDGAKPRKVLTPTASAAQPASTTVLIAELADTRKALREAREALRAIVRFWDNDPEGQVDHQLINAARAIASRPEGK